MPSLADLIEGIEKVKFFMYQTFNDDEDRELFSQLTEDVVGEGYEVLMSARANSANMEVLMKEKRESLRLCVVMIKMPKQYSILDIEGYPDVNNILRFSEFINKNSGIIGLQDAFD